jgi:2-polyprenyl-6-methoxyphenol hydroxylase-like FAD-dependent oxidoreductase
VAGKDEPIIIVGGGLGGAAAALALGRNGFRVRLLEQAEELGVIGFGIQLGPNVFPMFDRLGVTDAVMAHAIVPRAVMMVDSIDGGVIARIPTGASFEKRFKRPYIVIHRVDLHGVLLDACRALPNVELTAGCGIVSWEERGDGVDVLTEDSRTIRGAALIAADGQRSTVRQQMLHEGEPRTIGYVAHRTIVPMADVTFDVDREDVVLWSGHGFHIVHYPLRTGTLFNIVTVFRTSNETAPSDTDSPHPDLAHVYRDSHPTMKALWAMMDLSRRGWVSSDRDPIRHWSRGRVTLLGDAAHPTLQTLAQGACMAIEDAVCLAELVDINGGDFARAFRQYESARYLRTARVQFESRYLWDNFYHVGGIEREVARNIWSGRTEDDMYDCLAWLYDGFPLPQKRGAAA